MKKHIIIAAVATTATVIGVAGAVVRKLSDNKKEQDPEIMKRRDIVSLEARLMGATGDIWKNDDLEKIIDERLAELEDERFFWSTYSPDRAEELAKEIRELSEAVEYLKAHDALN